jgi:HEAT repeat protein
MCAVNFNQGSAVIEMVGGITSLPLAIKYHPDQELNDLLAALSPDISWGDRQIGAKRIGNLRNSEALPWLLATLPVDPFWMVRCSIIQALEMIGDPRAIPFLEEIAINDEFQVVRSYASKAVERLS